MKSIVLLQKPILDHPEFNTVIWRDIPEVIDIASWAEHVRNIILHNLTIEEDYVIEHLTKGSTPQTKGSLYPSPEISNAITLLYQAFGVSYIIN